MNKEDIIVNGTRVAIHAACSEWMEGDRYGEVVSFNSKRNIYRVMTDSGRVRYFSPSNVTEVE